MGGMKLGVQPVRWSESGKEVGSKHRDRRHTLSLLRTSAELRPPRMLPGPLDSLVKTQGAWAGETVWQVGHLPCMCQP